MSTRQSISGGGTWEPVVGGSRALRVGDHVSVSGTTAATPDGPAGGDDVGEQTRTCLTRIRAALIEAGATLEDVVRTRTYVTDISRREEAARVHAEFLGHVRPATTMVEVRAHRTGPAGRGRGRRDHPALGSPPGPAARRFPASTQASTTTGSGPGTT